MKSFVQASLLLALAVCPLVAFAGDGRVEPRHDRVAPPSGSAYSKEVPCGDSVTLLDSAPKGTAVSLNIGSCSCEDTVVVLNVIHDMNPSDLCSLKPGQDCMKDIPEGAGVYIGVTATPGSGTCKVTGNITP